MSRTYRKSREGKKYLEGNPLKDHSLRFVCHCDWCTSQKKRKLEKKIANKDMLREVSNFDSEI